MTDRVIPAAWRGLVRCALDRPTKPFSSLLAGL